MPPNLDPGDPKHPMPHHLPLRNPLCALHRAPRLLLPPPPPPRRACLRKAQSTFPLLELHTGHGDSTRKRHAEGVGGLLPTLGLDIHLPRGSHKPHPRTFPPPKVEFPREGQQLLQH